MTFAIAGALGVVMALSGLGRANSGAVWTLSILLFVAALLALLLDRARLRRDE